LTAINLDEGFIVFAGNPRTCSIDELFTVGPVPTGDACFDPWINAGRMICD